MPLLSASGYSNFGMKPTIFSLRLCYRIYSPRVVHAAHFHSRSGYKKNEKTLEARPNTVAAMYLLETLLYTVCLATALVSAAPTVERSHSLPIRKGLSQGGKHLSAKEVVERDLARISARSSRARDLSERAFSVVIINEDVSYVVPVILCGTTYYLVADTGSANTWVRFPS